MVDQDTPPISPASRLPDDGDLIDRALVAKIKAAGIGNRAAWGDLLARYQDRLFSVCFRMVGNRETAADLTQDAFVKILQGLDTWDGRSKLSTWIIRVTMNVCLSHLRAAKLRKHASLDQSKVSPVRGMMGSSPNHPQEPTPYASDREPGPDHGVQLQDQRRRVLTALAGLDPDQRAIIVLRDVQGLDYDQIAAALQTPVGTVKSRLFRARLAFRTLIEQHDRTSAPDR
jgi:RNA polymerase sigma-70 factor (ECF subfamily)